ncbi:XylR N-terminal domain-containing protein [Bacillus sp. V3B]|uniref:XylR N-terminal domain-containing protein n=1 Tax=Bacillus sp. V3B TaxID=2804915 RepID=UPI00210D635F|nr:XylR N-terminal domain-containing protein [Bacillus sp. V3B]MCQ6275486.1 XylR N-terminal domain-containing protein [Bacillus sp. V3B]
MGINLNLNENLYVKENGSLFMEDDRSILISISAFGTLRKNLIKNIGNERVKGFLIRHGWELGQEDAKKVLKKNLNTMKDVIEYGPILHRMRGNAEIEVTNLEMKPANDKISVHMEGVWRDSYEAEEHLRKFGFSHTPVCYTLIGYASGYLSRICNQMVIFKELSCQAESHRECKWVGQSLDYWDGEVDDELQFYQESPIVKELELTYEKLLEEKGNLEKSAIIHKKLTEELLQGNNLKSIAEVVYKETTTPGIITDDKHNPLAYTGISSSQLNEVNEEFKSYLQSKQTSRNKQDKQVFQEIHETKWVRLDHHTRLITPIYLQRKIKGYCSFIYLDEQVSHSKIHKMILERIALVSSHFLLNEATKFETEQRMMGNFFDEILRGEYEDEEEILRRGSFIHLDLSEPYRIAIVKYRVQENNLKKEFMFHEEMVKATSSYFKNKKGNILVGHRTKSVIVLIPNSYIEQEGIDTYLEHFLCFLSENFSEAVFFAGISKESDRIGKAKDCYNEAYTALRMTTMKNRIMLFDSLGMVGPLINQNNEKEIRYIARSMLGSLIDNVDHKKLDLIKTLYIFLENGGNLEQTACDNTLSLSGLRYRISRIEDLLKQNLRNPFYNYQLYLALQSLILIGELDLNLT